MDYQLNVLSRRENLYPPENLEPIKQIKEYRLAILQKCPLVTWILSEDKIKIDKYTHVQLYVYWKIVFSKYKQNVKFLFECMYYIWVQSILYETIWNLKFIWIFLTSIKIWSLFEKSPLK